jgi:hypothetical protein
MHFWVRSIAPKQRTGDRLAMSTNKGGRIASRKVQKAAEKLAPEDLPGDTSEQRWQYSVGNMAGEAISLQAFWDKTFGEAWKSFEVSSDLVTLAQQAADAWTQIANELTDKSTDEDGMEIIRDIIENFTPTAT